jgi:hypothetical protein
MRLPPDADQWWVFDPEMDREHYVCRLLEGYSNTPTAAGRVRPQDRTLAAHLFRQKVPFAAVDAAFTLAAARRVFRDPGLAPLAPIGSLNYFLPVIREILDTPIDPGHIGWLDWKLRHADEILRRDFADGDARR